MQHSTSTAYILALSASTLENSMVALSYYRSSPQHSIYAISVQFNHWSKTLKDASQPLIFGRLTLATNRNIRYTPAVAVGNINDDTQQLVKWCSWFSCVCIFYISRICSVYILFLGWQYKTAAYLYHGKNHIWCRYCEYSW